MSEKAWNWDHVLQLCQCHPINHKAQIKNNNKKTNHVA